MCCGSAKNPFPQGKCKHIAVHKQLFYEYLSQLTLPSCLVGIWDKMHCEGCELGLQFHSSVLIYFNSHGLSFKQACMPKTTHEDSLMSICHQNSVQTACFNLLRTRTTMLHPSYDHHAFLKIPTITYTQPPCHKHFNRSKHLTTNTTVLHQPHHNCY